MKRFRNIPNVTGNNDRAVLDAVSDAVAYITGQQQPVVQPLPTSATLSDCVAKINEILARLQGSG